MIMTDRSEVLSIVQALAAKLGSLPREYIVVALSNTLRVNCIYINCMHRLD